MTKREMKNRNCLGTEGLADYLGININRAYELMRSKDFPSVRISDRRWIVPLTSLERWLEEQAESKRDVS
ncbi:hypothetical protein AGMMS49992_24050 [Clostridia bacterium]|nr:hypothetical protein AGMMS49992_24050 [Clostridia bacterium]